ncbi:MAG: DUF134 domain-containing protein [Marinifilaceae bacterium]|jgi:predicted DNA-binding protein (UPF0251 family)|nr:DUF134 domain-containing protein [Marinifilaceae bacterium]
MPRKTRPRKVVKPPGFKKYSPNPDLSTEKEAVELLYEEYEALKLADYDNMNHLEASKLMGISRPTFARIYESARKKIAKAFVELKPIETVFGNAVMDKTWFVCKSCNASFSAPENMSNDNCPICSSTEIENIN